MTDDVFRRLIEEKNELRVKINKLANSISFSKEFEELDNENKTLLILQYQVMMQYLFILNERIEINQNKTEE